MKSESRIHRWSPKKDDKKSDEGEEQLRKRARLEREREATFDLHVTIMTAFFNSTLDKPLFKRVVNTKSAF